MFTNDGTNGSWHRRDLVIGTGLALVMGLLFTALSSGRSLLVTFLPGVVITWLVFVWLYRQRMALPSGSGLVPTYFVTLAGQFLHFAEEYVAGFNVAFPALYGGAPYGDQLFVTFNMIAYAVFTLTALAIAAGSPRFLLVPVLFFLIYGAIGNAVSHTWWSLWLGAYFPGLITAQAYWLLGPMALRTLVGSTRAALVILGMVAVVLIPLLVLFASPSAK